MYPATTSHAAVPDERRRNPRHRAPSIMYVQMDSANGGIVLNLGIDGVAFHAAQKLIAEKNSTLKLRLRGSGLLVDLTGELVWLSASQKEAGIRFRDLSGTVRQEIAGWIAREAQVFGPTGVTGGEDRPQPKTIPATPGIFDTGDMSERHPLSAALSISRAKPADAASTANADANGLFSPLPLDYVPPKSYLSQRQEVAPPNVERDFSDDEWEDEPQGRDPYSSLPPLPPRIEQHLHVQPLPEPAPIDDPRQPQAGNSSPYLLSLKRVAPARSGQPQAPEAQGMNDLRKSQEIEPRPVPPPVISSPYLLSLEKQSRARSDPSQTSAESAGRSEFRIADEIEPTLGPAAGNSSARLSSEPIPPVRGWRLPVSAQAAATNQPAKTVDAGPIPQARVSLWQDKLGLAAAVEKWIPPALLAAWRRAGIQHKVVFAISGVACLGIFALLLTLAVSHTDNSLPAAESTVHLQQPTAQQPAAQPLTTQQLTAQQFTTPPAATSVSNNSSQVASIQAPVAPPVAVPRRSVRPRKSLMAVFAQALLGVGSRDSDARHRIRDDQLGVQVWTSKRNGFYYCTDSDFYKSVQPGTFMAQSDAIQSGYQPKIGQFCN